NITWSVTDFVKVSISWAQQLEFHHNGYKSNTLSSSHNFHANSTWVHLFTDGAIARDTWNASAGGILGDQLGNWIPGFNRYLGKCSTFEAELWGILDGLPVMLIKGYRRAKIQTNNLDAVQALTNIGLEDSGITLLKRLHRIMRFQGQWQIEYLPREHNIVADRLAKLSLTWKSSLQVFDVALNEILEVLQHDKVCGTFKQLS
ncbi:hypothetical protein Goshw_029881, partial [Gossypium schwendimanii]|nr:hypothetical protein [Gossypium schwendimanii]